MGVPIRCALLCAGLTVATGLAACSSSGGGGSSETTGSVEPSRTTAAAARQITNVFKIFFDTKTSLAKSVTVLQHGSAFRSTLAKESKSPNAVEITAKVSTVNVVDKNLAQVTFTIYSGKTPLLSNSPGFAVREAGKWKVAAQTFCQLLTLEGTPASACKDKSITSLHG